jgi:hypothetical protein
VSAACGLPAWPERSHLGFLGAEWFRRKNPQLRLLDFLGFAWILSSESRLFNGLRGIFREEFFSGIFLVLRGRDDGEPAVEAMRKREIVHGRSLAPFLISCNQLYREPAPSAASIQKQLALIPAVDDVTIVRAARGAAGILADGLQ